MKLITFNIRNALAEDGANSWKNRKDFLYSYLRAQSADVICLQEVVPAVKSELIRVLGDMYGFTGEGRLSKPAEYDEINLIAYKKGTAELIKSEHFWLSETPDVAGSRYPTQEHWPRTCTHATLAVAGKQYDIFATHLDNVDKIARERGLKLIISRAETCERAVICGDFNDVPASVTRWIGGFTDLTQNITYTYTGYGEDLQKIDYVLAGKGLKRTAESVCDIQIKDGVYISDHFPVIAGLE